MTAIEHIEHERDFKVLCDGLLHFEIGPLVQTYSAAGADKGIDAEYQGALGGVEGRWVFQYKFSSPREAVSRRRAWLKSQYSPIRGKAGELDREGIAKADGYVLLTNIPTTVRLVHALEEQWRKRRKRGPFIVWDLLRLDAMLKGREHLARSWTGAKEARCRSHVIGPIWAWVERANHQLADPLNCPVWPLVVATTDERIHQLETLRLDLTLTWPVGAPTEREEHGHEHGAEGHQGEAGVAGAGQAAGQRVAGLQGDGLQPRQFLSVQGSV